MPWNEMGKACGTAVVAGLASLGAVRAVTVRGRKGELLALAAATLVWGVVVLAGLKLTRSELPGKLRRRKQTTVPTEEPIAATPEP